MKKLIAILLNIKGDFQNLFIFNEFDELTGKNRRGIITLTAILTLTFLALGFAIGGINYLKEKMDDPFTNWVNLEIGNAYRGKVPYIIEDMEADTARARYMLNNIGEYNLIRTQILHRETGEKFPYKLRTIDLDDNILKEILLTTNNNVVHGYEYSGEGEVDMDLCQIIIREDALENLGYESPEELKRLGIEIDENRILYPEVISVVKELPNLVNLMVTSHFYQLIFLPYEETNFINISNKNTFEISSRDRDQKKVESEIRKGLEGFYIESIDFDSIELSVGDTRLISKVYLDTFIDLAQADELYKDFNKKTSVDFEKHTEWLCDIGEEIGIDDPFYLSFNFDQLDNVRDFKNYLNDKYSVEISMDQVEQKENFALVSRLTGFISLILFGFSILSIVFYVNSLLRTHLEKIKMNLGTLKAFGLDNKFLVSSYLKIILTFIGISIVIAFLICVVWNFIEPMLFANSYFDIFNWKLFAGILVIILTALYTSRFTIKKTLMKTPGDLIYNR